jgi:hypothetical protein
MKKPKKLNKRTIESAERRGHHAALAKILKPIIDGIKREAENRTGKSPIFSPTACSVLIECLGEAGYKADDAR